MKGSGKPAPSRLMERGRLCAQLLAVRPRHMRKASSSPCFPAWLPRLSEAPIDDTCLWSERASGALSPVRVVLLIDPRSPCHCQGMPQRLSDVLTAVPHLTRWPCLPLQLPLG